MDATTQAAMSIDTATKVGQLHQNRQWVAYATDFARRSILFMDTLRGSASKARS